MIASTGASRAASASGASTAGASIGGTPSPGTCWLLKPQPEHTSARRPNTSTAERMRPVSQNRRSRWTQSFALACVADHNVGVSTTTVAPAAPVANRFDRLCAARRREHELALDLALLDSLERLGRALERQHRVDRGPQLALGDPLEDQVGVLAVGHRIARRERAPEHADDLAALE